MRVNALLNTVFFLSLWERMVNLPSYVLIIKKKTWQFSFFEKKKKIEGHKLDRETNVNKTKQENVRGHCSDVALDILPLLKSRETQHPAQHVTHNQLPHWLGLQLPICFTFCRI